jgi:hypothetical protein
MPLLAYLVTIALAVGAVLIEIEWLVASPPNHAPSKTAAQSHAPAPPPPAKGRAALSPIYPASPGAETHTDTAVTAASEAADRADAGGSASPRDAHAAFSPAEKPVASQPNNRCDVRACASAYRSFRESDCTYQPYSGPRQFCDKAATDSAPVRTTEARFSSPAQRGLDARAEAACNFAVCARHYSSFRPSDCSYQPYDGGPRRLCER